MIANCYGCQTEYWMAEELIASGKYHIATTNDNHFLGKGHLILLVVNDKGELVLC